jgi:ComF family protein
LRARGAAALLDFLLPRGCLACGSWRPQGSEADALLCGLCRSRLRQASWPRCPRCHLPVGTGRTPARDCRECRDWPSSLGHARYAWVLEPPASDMVHALKYGGWSELAREMGGDMAGLRLPRLTAARAVVVPVPTTAKRGRRRGYNQAELLARAFAGARGLGVVDGLRRAGEGATQVALHPSQRRANVRGVFTAREGASRRLRGTHVLLVDDVLTTGSTAAEAAAELARMGASQVTLVAFARALPGV